MRKFVPIETPLVTIDSVGFSVMSNCDIAKQSEIPINNREIYYYLSNKPFPYGVLDLRLGTNRNDQKCKTCNLGLTECLGHWGYIDLHLPVFHIGFFKYTIQILSCICKKCSYLLISEDNMKRFKDQALITTDPLAKKILFKRLVAECRKVIKCPRCNSTQGSLKRIVKPTLDQFMKIRHTVKQKQGGKMQTVEEDLDPLYVKSLFKSINPAHLLVLNIDKPENLIISSIPVPPSCIRPSVTLDEHGSTEDDLTCILSDIVDLNNLIKSQCKNGFQTNQFIGNWQFMQLQCTRYINSESPAVSQLLATKNITKSSRGICQRLKGKEGRFRGNLSGKRVDFSARTVISPDPNVGIDQVVVPKYIAQRLTYPERVNTTNINILKRAVLNGPDSWPGACYVNKLDGSKCNLRYANPKNVSERLAVGDIVERHIWDGDIVLFNRQPSLHRMSIMAHRAIVMQGSTLRFNECVCSPYNADFDGDEMNLHFPQTEEARAEAFHLMGVLNNLTSPKNGEPLVAAVQDFLSASYLLTSKDYFLDKKKIFNLCCSFCDGIEHIDVPPPAIIYPIQLWTGKQVFSLLLSPNRKDRTYINLELKEREFKPYKSNTSVYGNSDVMSPSDGYVVVSNSELMCGSVGKNTLGPGKSGLIFHLLRNQGSKSTSKFLSRISKLTCRWLCEYGLSIGIDDVIPSHELILEKGVVLNNGYKKVDHEIEKYNRGEIQAKFGCSAQETLELIIKGELDDLRNQAGKVCYEHLPPQNKPLIMFNSGAKGSLINIAQMIACVGQQNVSGQRIQNGFVNRSLPHFEMDSLEPKSRGFVANSFFTGLDPQEFFFHTMSGREGLIDTAVKTAETGYMQRRLMKALEDLSVCYDHTVRTSDGQVVQFLYGDDGISPCSLGVFHMEDTLKMLQARSNSKQFGDYKGPILPPSEPPTLDLEALRAMKLPKFLQERLESLQYLKSDEYAYEMISNQLKCYLVIHRMGHKINVPLFPFEISRWTRFIYSLVKGFIPAKLSQHLNINSTGDCDMSKDSVSAVFRDFESDSLHWIERKAEEIAEYRQLEGAEPGRSEFTEWPSRNVIQKVCYQLDGNKRKRITYNMPVNKKYVITLRHLYNLCISCWRDYKNAIAEPGDAVGALGAQSIGEPGTQMTLKTFHFAGVASMNVTLGVPRIKEIINATANIQTPIIEVPLVSSKFEAALINKYRIEKTTIGNICKKFEDIYSPHGSFIILTIDQGICADLGLCISANHVKEVIVGYSSINKIRLDKNSIYVLDNDRLAILVPHTNCGLYMFQKQSLIDGLMSLVLSGEKFVKRGVIKKEGGEYHLAVEGYGLLNIMGIPGVVGTKVKSNHVIEVAKVLGIEAARSVIISEICKCMDAYSIEIDYRHMCLLGDVMTFRGEVLGINRFGIQKMRTSTLMLASFEETNEHLFEAAVHNRRDPICGVSECIITGKPIKLGTGSFDLLLY